MKKKYLLMVTFLMGALFLVGCSSAETKAPVQSTKLEIKSGEEYYIFNSDGSDPQIAFERWDVWGNEWTPQTCEVEGIEEDGMKVTKITTIGAGWFGYAAAGEKKDFTKFSKLKVKVKTKLPKLTMIFQGGREWKIKVDISKLPDLENGWKQMEIDVPEENKGVAIAFLGEGTSKGDTVMFTDMILVAK